LGEEGIDDVQVAAHTGLGDGGGHFREEFQTEDGEALRDDEKYAYVAAWEFKGQNEFELHKEELKYENIKIAQRSYK
jgi:succinate dehydrogenase / fumarate reductase flavoprotein subunit